MNRSAWPRAVAAFALLVCVSALAACDWFYNRYSESEESRLLAVGESMAREWADAEMPGGEVFDLRAHTYQILGGPTYLSDYVDFKVAYEGTEHELMMNTATGEMYEAIDNQELKQAVGRHVPELFGIEGEASIEVGIADLYVPYSAECASDKADIEGMRVSMVPYGTDDLDAFVMDASSRPLIEVAISGEGPEMAAVQDLSDVFALRESCGLFVDFLLYGNEDFSIDMYNEGSLEYWHKSWQEAGDFLVYARDRELSQSGDPRTGEATTVSESGFDAGRDLEIERTDTGYRFTVPAGAENWYCIGASPDSPALSSGYHAIVADGEGSELELVWDTESYEYPTLVDGSGDSFKTKYGVELERSGARD